MIAPGTTHPALQPATPPPEPRRIAFASAAALRPVAEAGVGKVAHLRAANVLAKAFAPFDRFNFNMMGLSMEDWAMRCLTLGVYIPQGWVSIRQNRHKWENNGRNVLLWTMTFVVTMLAKHKKYGVNAGVDQFMKPRKEGEKVNAVVDKFRLKGNYFDLLERAGVKMSADDKKSAYWSTLDKNQLDVVEVYRRKLLEDAQKTTGKTGETALKAATEGQFLRKVVNRITAAKLVSTGIITLVTMYLMGNAAMWLIFNTVARLDPDFNPNALKKTKQNKSQAAQQPSPPQLAQLPATPPPLTQPAAPVSPTPATGYPPAIPNYGGTGQ